MAFHVIGSSPDSGMRMGEGTIYRTFADLFVHLRMPLFTFLSGFVYAYRPVRPGHAGEFAIKKLARLGLPFLTVSTIYFLLTFVAGDVKGKMPLEEGWKIYVFPYVHFWFLQAIALIFAATVALEKVGAVADPRRFAATMVGAVALSLWSDPVIGDDSLLSYQKALFLLPFFLLGVGANRFRNVLRRPAVLGVCAVAFVATATAHGWLVLVAREGSEVGSPLGLALGMSGVAVLIAWTPRIRWLERIGTYSFAIYLFHPFAVAPARKILQTVGLDAHALLFTTGLAAGVLCPIVLERLSKNVPLAQRLLLGQRPAGHAAARRAGAPPSELPKSSARSAAR